MKMEYMLKVLDLEKEIDKLKVINQTHMKYIDLKRKLKELDRFAIKIAEMDLKESDKLNFLSRVDEYKNKVEQYETTQAIPRNKNYGITQTLLSFFLGIFCFGTGLKLKEIYKLYKERKTDEMADYIYERLSGVDLSNE